MTRDETIQTLKELLRQQKQLKVDLEALTPESRLDKVGFDSLSILDFMYDVESRFHVQIPVADLVQMERVGDLIDYLAARAKG
ncbi:MAG: acyl carrier protein [Limisphaerales bacterium]